MSDNVVSFRCVDMSMLPENYRRAMAGREQSTSANDSSLLLKLGVIAIVLLGVGFAAGTATAVGQTTNGCGQMHTVSTGETLFDIANTAYGDGWKYPKIFAANRDLLPDEKSIEIGDQILIPCLDGTGPATRREALAAMSTAEPAGPEMVADDLADPEMAADDLADPEMAAEELAGPEMAAEELAGPEMVADDLADPEMAADDLAGPEMAAEELAGPEMAADDLAGPEMVADDLAGLEMAAETGEGTPVLSAPPPIRFVTGSDFGLFAGEHLTNGGLATDLIARSIAEVAPGQDFEVVFTDDWSMHLSALENDGPFDVSFPWFDPGCATPDRLDAAAKHFCARYDLSNPFLEVKFGVYARAGDPVLEATTVAALDGKKSCRPRSEKSSNLPQGDRSTTNLSIERAESAWECFVKLMRGDVDVVMLRTAEAVKVMGQLMFASYVAEVKGLRTTQTLHAVAAKSNPNGSDQLDILNRGLEQMMRSGKWFAVVADHHGRQLTAGL